MPIKPENKARYPKNWKEIRDEIIVRASNQCECFGECGLHTTSGRCTEKNGTTAVFAKGKIVLTVAHLDHTPENNQSGNLRAMCQRCHLRYDREHHAKNSKITRQLKKEKGLI